MTALASLRPISVNVTTPMQRLERGRTDPALKRQIIENLKRRHRERRLPYVMLIAELQKHLVSPLAGDLQVVG